MTEAQIIADLKSKGYTSAQAYAICKSRMKPKAQFGAMPPTAFIEGELPDFSGLGQNPNYTPAPMNSNLSGYEFTGTDLNLSDRQQNRLVNRYNRDSFQSQNTQEINKTVIDNPFGGVSLDNALNYAGRGFGEKDPWKAGIGTSLSLLKGSRNFLSGYGAGKVNREGYEDYIKRLNKDMTPNQVFQSGGKFKNSEVLAMNALTDNPQGNVNAEGGEFVKRINGMVQPIVGENHVKNGKKADGVDVKLNDGDKVLSDYIKLRPNDIKELKERYKIALKKGDTPAKALAKIETKIGLKKETEKLADSAEKLEKALKIKDPVSKELSIETLQNIIATQNEKIANLKQVSAVAFEDLFEMQEEQPKKDTSKLYDKNGKEVEDEEDDNMQMGGVYELANKFGISKERAKELVSMQMGGEQNGAPQEQIMQMVMQMLQDGATPEQVVQQLIQQGLPQDQAVQVVEMMIQQAQGQMEAPQEGMEMAQQGSRIGNKYENPDLFKKQGATSDDWSSFGELLKEKPQEVLSEIKRVHPELYNIYFKDGKINKSNIAEFQIAVNNKYDSILQDAGNLYGKDSQEVKELQAQIEKDKFLIEQGNIRDVDAMLGNYTATRPNFKLPILPKEDLDKVNKSGVNTASELKEKFPDLYKKYVEAKGLKSDFWLGDINQPKSLEQKATPTSTEELDNTNQELGVENRVKRAMAFLPTDLRLPPSGVPPLLKSEVNLGRIEPIKQTIEPYLANQASQLYTAQEQLSATGLPPQIQQALQAQAFASNQIASNDAISKVEQFNNQQQFSADQFNIGQRAKEDITNEQFAQSYQDKMLGSMANTERDYRNYLIEGNLQNRANWKDIENANLLNANVENYQYTPGVGVDYIDNRAGDLSKGLPSPTPEQLASWTPEELQDYMRKSDALRKKKLANNQQ